jgi:hypothetical protein
MATRNAQSLRGQGIVLVVEGISLLAQVVAAAIWIGWLLGFISLSGWPYVIGIALVVTVIEGLVESTFLESDQ